MKYHDATVNPRYNGNIAQMSWNTAGNTGAYDFTYDGANRLTDAVTTAGPDFSERLIQYDANGNIQTLKRGAASPINYTYNANIPNRLNSVSGGLSVTFTYDGNGNMTNDNTKGEFTYDYRNMPIKVVTNDTVIEYAYDAAGQRIRKTLKNGGSTLSETIYVRGTNGNIIAEYRNEQIDHFNIYGNGLIGKLVPALASISISNQTISNQMVVARDSVTVHPESTIQDESTIESGEQAAGSDKRYYYLSDHLGSTRVVLDQSGNVDSWTDYYPFGKEARGSSTTNRPKEQFTGKQRDSEIGLDYFGARYYDAEIGRWTSVDPLVGRFPNLSPYHYGYNNPVRVADPNGLSGNDMVKAAEKYWGNAYELGGKNPTIPGLGYSDMYTYERQVVDQSNSMAGAAMANYGWEFGSSRANGFNMANSYGMDCSGIHNFAFNSNPDVPSDLKVNPMMMGAAGLSEYFKTNGNGSGYVGQDGQSFLQLSTDINSSNVKTGDALFFGIGDSKVFDHVAMVDMVLRSDDGNVLGILTYEAPSPGENVGYKYRTAEELKKAGFSGYGIINQNVNGSTTVKKKEEENK